MSVINELKRVALVQDWLTGMRGGEKVLEELCGRFPDAPLYTLIHIPGSVSDKIENRNIHVSALQHIPLGRRYYRHFLPLMPFLVKGLNLKKYDAVISTSHCVAKNIKTSEKGMHICYCHTPMRYIWDMFDHYFGPGKNLPVYLLMLFFRPYLRFIDVRTSRNVTYFIANSATTADRIKKYYNRDSQIIYPPVDVDYYTPSGGPRENFYLIVSSLVPYKKVDIAVRAFNINGKFLKIIGSGPEAEKLRKIAGKNIVFEGWTDREGLRENYRKCRALIFPGKEDFGIVPVEAMACAAPVIGYNQGGVTESVIEGETGIFFDEQTPQSLNSAIERFETMSFDNQKIRFRAQQFSSQRFMDEIEKFLESKLCFQ